MTVPYSHLIRTIPCKSPPPAAADDDGATLAYAPLVTEAVLAKLRTLSRPVIIFTPTPGVIRDAIQDIGITIELAPDRLLAEFRRNVAGL
jgi:hypothetical protein